MIGLELAAGAGRRLRPDTDALPKALLPVAGTATILDIAVRNLAAAGLDEVVIVVGHAAQAISGRAAALERARSRPGAEQSPRPIDCAEYAISYC